MFKILYLTFSINGSYRCQDFSDKLIVKIDDNYYLTAITDKKKLKKMNIKKFKEHTDTLDITRPKYIG